MQYEVELRLTCYVNIDVGDAEVAKAVARDKVANGPCLFVAQGLCEGAHPRAGHYLVKGMSAEAVSAKPWLGNMRVTGKNLSNAEPSEEEEGWRPP